MDNPVPEKPPKRTLLQKYDIPLNHLDFDYIKQCENVKELEKIVLILKSGEEGHYYELTECAVNKLRKLNPTSKLLREEVPLLTQHSMDNHEWKELSNNVKNWEKEVKEKENSLRKSDLKNVIDQHSHIPVRQVQPKDAVVNSNNAEKKKKMERIRACDYNQWDKYDAETEMLKIDLEVEKTREQATIERMKESNITPKIQIIESNNLSALSDIEKQEMANNYRLKGNDFFKSNEYKNAIAEYTQSLSISPTAVVYNNRAMAYLKLYDNTNAIKDCDQCLQIEPSNIKAMLRKGQALMNESKSNVAYRVYLDVLKIDSKNINALTVVKQLKAKYADLPPVDAVRMKIQNGDDEPKVSSRNGTKPPTTTTAAEQLNTEDYDFSKLIIPKNIKPSQLAQMASNMDNMKKQDKLNGNKENKKQQQPKKKQPKVKEPEIIIPRTTRIKEYPNGVIIEEL